MNRLVPLIKRFLVLVPGIVISYFAVTRIYPSLDRRTNVLFGVWATYVITAYLLIPLALRLLRIIIKPKHLPLYCTTPDGFASDPVNIGIIGTRQGIIGAMEEIGWVQADSRTPSNLFRLIISSFFSRSYPTAPMSSLYLFGRSQDIAFEKQLKSSTKHRHHVRFWAVTYTTDPRYRDHVFFWQRHHKAETPDRVLWVGAASLDVGLNLIRHNAQFTHRVHADTNAERRLIIKDLKKTGNVKATKEIRVGKPYRLQNRGINSFLKADGKVVIAELKP